MNLTLSNVTTPALALAAILAAGCSSDDSNDTPPPTPDPANVTAGVNSLGLTTLASVLTSSGLDTVLEGDGPFTMFAPTNAAFAALDPDTLAFLTDAANVAVLEDALRYHVLDGDVDSATAAGLITTTANNGDDINIETVDGSLYLNDARVANADVTVGNGRIHVVDSVLLPPMDIATALAERGLDSLVSAATYASLDLTAAPVTVLAPSDAAFDAFGVAQGEADFAAYLATSPVVADVEALLNAHIVGGAANTAGTVVAAGDAASAGGSLLFFNAEAGAAPTVDGIDITAFNIPTTQSLIHEIDSVITVRDSAVDVATAAGLATLLANIAQVDASQSNDLTGTIGAAPALTIFAPSDAAWADAGLVNLQDGSNDALLEQVLRYHVVADAIQAKELATLTTVDSLDADPIAISVDMNGVITLTGDAAGTNETMPVVGMNNVFAVNAVVHVIDAVLIPPGVTLP